MAKDIYNYNATKIRIKMNCRIIYDGEFENLGIRLFLHGESQRLITEGHKVKIYLSALFMKN